MKVKWNDKLIQIEILEDSKEESVNSSVALPPSDKKKVFNHSGGVIAKVISKGSCYSGFSSMLVPNTLVIVDVSAIMSTKLDGEIVHFINENNVYGIILNPEQDKN